MSRHLSSSHTDRSLLIAPKCSWQFTWPASCCNVKLGKCSGSKTNVLTFFCYSLSKWHMLMLKQKCEMLKWSEQLIPHLRVFLEKLGYRKLLGTQNNVCPCLWSNRQSRGNGWILGLKKNRGGKQGSKKTERERERERKGEGQHVKAESVLSESHVHGPGVCVTGAAHVTVWLILEAQHVPIHTRTHSSINVMCANYGNCLKIDGNTQVRAYSNSCYATKAIPHKQVKIGKILENTSICKAMVKVLGRPENDDSLKRQVATKPSEAKSRAIQNWFNEIRL